MHRVERPLNKPASREVTVHCTDRDGVSQQQQVPLTSLATFILNSVQARKADQWAAQLERIDWSNSNV